MKETITCPKCGTENPVEAVNCIFCGIKLNPAPDIPVEIEPIKLQDTLIENSGSATTAPDVGSGLRSMKKPILLPVLLLLGSFMFAFCLGEAVHEFGHFLAHRAYGVDVGIRLDPFGGSRILNGSSAPQEIMGITSLAGPLLNLLAGVAVSLSLWRVRKPMLLPLVLWGPVALVQEGVTFSLGMLTPGGDAAFIVAWGVPAVVVIGLGVLFLASGIVTIGWLLPLMNLSPADSFGRKFALVTGGMVSFFVLRLIVSSIVTSSPVMENVVPLVFSILLATLVAGLYKPLHSALNRISKTRITAVTWPAPVMSIALGVGIIVFQLVTFK